MYFATSFINFLNFSSENWLKLREDKTIFGGGGGGGGGGGKMPP